MIVSPDELVRYRAELAENPEALAALIMLEDCEGDLEDAAIALALREGQEPDQSEGWLDGFAKRWRVYVCQSGVRGHLETGAIALGIQLLAAEMVLPVDLATLVAIYVQKTGVETFCKPLEERL